MPKEPERGETTAAREQKAMAPMPQEPPAATPEEIAQEAAAPPEEAPPVEAATAPPPEVQGFTVRNPYMLLPPTINLGQRQLTTAEKDYNVGLLWQALASDPRAPALTKAIAQYFAGEENGS